MKARKGFTLLEMMIVVVIIGILAAVALPMYSEYVKKSRTGEAKAALGDIRLAQLAYYDDPMLGDHTYASNIVGLGWTLDNGTTKGKSPAFYAYTTADTQSTATAGDSGSVPTGYGTLNMSHSGTMTTGS